MLYEAMVLMKLSMSKGKCKCRGKAGITLVLPLVPHPSVHSHITK